MASVADLSFDDACAQFAAWLLTARGRSRATVDSYSRDLEQFGELMQPGRLSALDKRMVLRWNEKLHKAELSPRSRARKYSALRAFIGWALEYGHLDKDPIPPDLSAPKSLYLPYALTEAEVQAMLKVVEEKIHSGTGAIAGGKEPDTSIGARARAGEQLAGNATGDGARATAPQGKLGAALALRDRAIVETLYASGMRVSELCGLRLLDLHLPEGFAIVTGKGSKQRLVPLGQYAIDALKDWLEARGELCQRAAQHGEVFLSQRGPISRSQVFRMIKAVAAAAEIKGKVSPHTFRHSCASHLLAHGADLRLVQELLGHSALSTTQVYTHIEKSRLRKVYDECHPMA